MRMRAFARAWREWQTYENAVRLDKNTKIRPPSGYWAETVQAIEFELAKQSLRTRGTE